MESGVATQFLRGLIVLELNLMADISYAICPTKHMLCRVRRINARAPTPNSRTQNLIVNSFPLNSKKIQAIRNSITTQRLDCFSLLGISKPCTSWKPKETRAIAGLSAQRCLRPHKSYTCSTLPFVIAYRLKRLIQPMSNCRTLHRQFEQMSDKDFIAQRCNCLFVSSTLSWYSSAVTP